MSGLPNREPLNTERDRRFTRSAWRQVDPPSMRPGHAANASTLRLPVSLEKKTGRVLFRKSNGRLPCAQALGEDGVDKRISALAMALQMGATVYDCEEAELCYAPQFGSAKDPVNFAGMVAADVLPGDMPISHWDSTIGEFILDVREPFADLA